MDTAAQVSLIRQSVWEKIDIQHDAIPETVQLANAQKDSGMEGKLFSHVGFILGGGKYYIDIVVADISDPIILGLDFLKMNKCKINLEEDSLELNGMEKIFAVMKGETSDKRYHVSRVMLTKKTTIPPHSIKFVSVKLQNPANVGYAVEPNPRPSLFIHSMEVNGEEEVTFCLLNMSAHNMKFRRNEELRRATKVDAMLQRQDVDNGDGEIQADLYICAEEPAEMHMKVCRVRKIVEGIPEVELEEGTKGANVMEVRDPGLGVHTCSESNEMQECVVMPQDKPPEVRDVRDPGLEVHKRSEFTVTLECVVNPQHKPPDAREVRDFAEMDHSGSESRETLEPAVKPQDKPPDSPVGQRVSAQEVMRQIQSIGVTGTKQGGDPRSESKARLEWVDSLSQEEDGSQQLPEYLRKLYTDACTRLTKSQTQKVLAVLLNYAEIFAATDLDIGGFTVLVH